MLTEQKRGMKEHPDVFKNGLCLTKEIISYYGSHSIWEKRRGGARAEGQKGKRGQRRGGEKKRRKRERKNKKQTLSTNL